MNWKGHVRNLPWANLNCYPGNCIEKLRKATKDLSQVIQSLYQCLNLRLPEHKTGMPPTWPQCWVQSEKLTTCIWLMLQIRIHGNYLLPPIHLHSMMLRPRSNICIYLFMFLPPSASHGTGHVNPWALPEQSFFWGEGGSRWFVFRISLISLKNIFMDCSEFWASILQHRWCHI